MRRTSPFHQQWCQWCCFVAGMFAVGRFVAGYFAAECFAAGQLLFQQVGPTGPGCYFVNQHSRICCIGRPIVLPICLGPAELVGWNV